MDARKLVVHLESPLSAYNSAGGEAREVILAGLNWQTEYWAALAVGWLEQGAPMDAEIASSLHALVEKKHFSQAVRHRAFAFARRYEKGDLNAQPIIQVGLANASPLIQTLGFHTNVRGNDQNLS